MARIMIMCQNVKEPVYTGMTHDEATFAGANLIGLPFACPRCGLTHIWRKKDAFLEGATPPGR